MRPFAQIVLFVVCLLPTLSIAQSKSAPQAQNSPTHSEKAEELSDWFDLLLAAQAGGGLDATSSRQPTAFAGVKLGFPLLYNKKGDFARTFTLDLQYDRLQSHSGFATEFSAMLPIFRVPGPQTDSSKNYIRFYAEPGLGYRTGDGAFGGYASAKFMMALLSDRRLTTAQSWGSPYIEIQRRFPFGDPLHGDTRVALGLAVMICKHCGIE